jgi:uncharacterized cofD-like protein
MEPKKVVCIGGGTGLSTMLRGLKAHTEELTAIVTVSDNGGNSGNLRKELNVLPPGDIRSCLLALAETEPMLEALFSHRFQEGSLKGHNLGNLFIVGLADLYGNFGVAVEKAHDVLRVKGKVLPVTIEDVQLKAIYDDGSEVIGECEIVSANKSHKKRIREMKLMPNQPKVYKNVLEAIAEAEVIVLGPGSLYTSIVPNLLVEGVCEAIREAKGQVVYIGNIMTQPGETEGFTLLEHINVIEQYLGVGVIDKIIANDGWPDTMLIEHYNQDGAELVLPLLEDHRIITVPMVVVNQKTGFLRHNSDLLAQTIMTLVQGEQ